MAIKKPYSQTDDWQQLHKDIVEAERKSNKELELEVQKEKQKTVRCSDESAPSAGVLCSR